MPFSLDAMNLRHLLSGFLALYLASALGMLVANRLALENWTQSWRKRYTKLSLVLWWHPLCPPDIHTHKFAVLAPTNEDRRSFLLLALVPVLNSSTLLLWTAIFPCCWLRQQYVELCFGDEASYRRWLQAR